jgi:hypothetical protein
MWRIGLYVLCGIIVDLMITIYTRSVSLGRGGRASLFAGVITVVTFWILNKIAIKWNAKLVLAYAVGTAIGTWLGMQIF